jgi:hypothetical protein
VAPAKYIGYNFKGSELELNAANSNSDGRLAFISANKFLVTNELVGAVLKGCNITKSC